MRLTCAPQSPTLTRYWISAHLGPRTRLILAHPETGEIMASWMSGLDSEVVRGVWLSTIPDLVGMVDGFDHEFGDDSCIPERELERVSDEPRTERLRTRPRCHEAHG
ncbi:MAG: hypothetical protein ABIR68_10155 [Ilumatobacteraceae bacterium]